MCVANQSLIEITKSLHDLELQILESQGEINSEIEARYNSEIIAREKKIDSYAAIIERCKLLESQYKLKAEKNLKTAKGYKRVYESLRFNLKQAMILLGSDELAGDEVRFKLTSAQEAVEVIDEGLLPLEYLDMKTVYTPNKERIKAALLNGLDVPGAKLTNVQQLRTYPAKGVK